MGDERPKVLVVGAGVCGLYAGLTLVRGGAEVTIVEKESRIGGLAAGFKFGDNFCDFGVHMLHAFNQEVFEDCASLMGRERIEAALDARIRWGGMSCRYPLRFKDMLKAMPPFTLLRCVLGLVIAELTGAKKRSGIDNAEDALIAFYGAPLYEYFFEEFTHKYWDVHPRDLSAEFIRRKMPRLSAVDVLRRLLPWKKKHMEGATESALDTEVLHYSRSGSETLPRSLAAEFTRLGGNLVTGAHLSKLSISSCGAEYVHEGEGYTWRGDHLISTAPLHVLFDLLGDEAPGEMHSAVGYLRYKPTVVYAILVRRERCMEGLYTYYRNRTFHRIGEPKNAGLEVRPEGHSVLTIESTCELNDYKWNGSERYKEEIVAGLLEEGLCDEVDILSWNLMKTPYGYPVFTNGFDSHLAMLQSWIDDQSCLSSVGRQGGFCYPAMHTAMQLGKDAAKDVLS